MPRRERDICGRIAEAREIAQETQNGLAKLVGIPRARLAMYERARAPVKCDLALRICRKLIVNEEWLAPGKTLTLDRVAARELGPPSGSDLSTMRKKIFVRQCVDLLSEPAANSVAPGTLFSSAFDTRLKDVYVRLAEPNLDFPRIVFTDSLSEPELAARLINVIFARELVLVEWLTRNYGLEAWPIHRQFTLGIIELSLKAFRELAGNEFDLPGFRAFIEAVKATKRRSSPQRPREATSGVK